MNVLWICASRADYDQLLKINHCFECGWHKDERFGDWIAATATLRTHEGIHLSVTATYATHVGGESAQSIACALFAKQSDKIDCLVMSGTCAGRFGEVSLGDVIFAERIWKYDSGKIQVENGETRFQGDILQYRPKSVWVQHMQALNSEYHLKCLQSAPSFPLEIQENWLLSQLRDNKNAFLMGAERQQFCPNWEDVLQRARHNGYVARTGLELTQAGRDYAQELCILYPDGLPKPKGFKIHVAPMATGSAVVEDANIFQRLSESMRKVLAVEMEASAMAALAETCDVPFIIAKGVSNYGDADKNDFHQKFAALASAECILALLQASGSLLANEEEKALLSLRESQKVALSILSKLFIESHEHEGALCACIRQISPISLCELFPLANFVRNYPQHVNGLFALLIENNQFSKWRIEIKDAHDLLVKDFGTPQYFPNRHPSKTTSKPVLLVAIEPYSQEISLIDVFYFDGTENTRSLAQSIQINIFSTEGQNVLINGLRKIIAKEKIRTQDVLIEFALPDEVFIQSQTMGAAIRNIAMWGDDGRAGLAIGLLTQVVIRSLERMKHSEYHVDWHNRWAVIQKQFGITMNADELSSHLHWIQTRECFLQDQSEKGIFFVLDSAVTPDDLLLYWEFAYQNAISIVLFLNAAVNKPSLIEMLKGLTLDQKTLSHFPNMLNNIRKNINLGEQQYQALKSASLLWDDPSHIPPKYLEHDDVWAMAPC